MIAALFSLGKRRISRGGLVAERLNKDSDCVDGGDSSLCLSADLIGRGGRGLGRAELRQVPLLASNRVKQLLFLSTGLLHFFLSFFGPLRLPTGIFTVARVALAASWRCLYEYVQASTCIAI